MSRIIIIVSFAALGMWDGLIATILLIVRNVFSEYFANRSEAARKILCLLTWFAFTIMCALTFDGIPAVALLMCNYINSYGVIICSEQGIRLTALFGAVFYIIYLLLNFNYAGVGCEIIGIVITLISYFKYRKGSV